MIKYLKDVRLDIGISEVYGDGFTVAFKGLNFVRDGLRISMSPDNMALINDFPLYDLSSKNIRAQVMK